MLMRTPGTGRRQRRPDGLLAAGQRLLPVWTTTSGTRCMPGSTSTCRVGLSPAGIFTTDRDSRMDPATCRRIFEAHTTFDLVGGQVHFEEPDGVRDGPESGQPPVPAGQQPDIRRHALRRSAADLCCRCGIAFITRPETALIVLFAGLEYLAFLMLVVGLARPSAATLSRSELRTDRIMTGISDPLHSHQFNI